MKGALFAVILAAGAYLCSSCFVMVRTREYVPEHEKRVPVLDGWVAEFDIYAYKNVSGADPQTWWKFNHSICFSKKRSRKNAVLGKMTAIMVDTISIEFPSLVSTITLPFDHGTWVGHGSRDSLEYVASFRCRDSMYCFTYYPKNIKEAKLHMHAKLYEATHSFTTQYGVTTIDSVLVDRAKLLGDSVFVIPIRLHEWAFPSPF